jgi:hypothetical protein
LTTLMQDSARERCGAPAKTTGAPCKRRPEPGGTVCKLHGGALPNVKQAAAFRIARDQAQQEALRRLRAEKATKQDTVTEMDRLAAEVIAFKDVCRERIEFLSEIRYEGKTGEQIRAEITLYERALDRCNTVLATNLKLGIAERKQKLDEAQALLVVGLMRAVLGRLNLSKEQQQLAARVVPEEMRAISGVIQGELVA